ncbi:MAG: hypothetical protein IT440_03865 [Phycisphaeraceae bacterium]|nr:hypothetical protein [Phycisphaeraceae bacterium]
MGCAANRFGSRKAFVSPSTFHPTSGPGGWMQQQARNVSMWLEDEHLDLRFLIHDRDTKFTEAFDEHFRHLASARHSKSNGIVKTPFLAPVANCYFRGPNRGSATASGKC